MRTSSGLFLLSVAALAGCDRAPSPDTGNAEAGGSAEVERVPCKLGGASGFEPVCSVERTSGTRGLELTLRHPDGGFRRLLVTRDGRGVVAADGAEPARVTVVDDGAIEVAFSDATYRLPATVRGR